MKTNQLLFRLIEFNNAIYNISLVLNNRRELFHLIDQILRSSSSSVLNYSEALVTKTDKDYANKVRLALKEMNESCSIIMLLKGRTSEHYLQELTKLEEEASSLLAILGACCRKVENRISNQ